MRRHAALVMALLAGTWFGPAAVAEPSHGIAMHGSVRYPADFKHFDYADPNAPKGGRLTQAAIGSFDSLNPFVIKGSPAAGSGLVYETLTEHSQDEAFTEYGLIAESIEVPDDRSWVIFKLRPEARWHDGKPITVDDVIFTLETLRTKGRPFYRAYYANVAKAEDLGDRRVKFTFDGTVNRELPLILGQMTILPKHYWADKDFEKTTLEPPLGSGPYRVATVDTGRSITYERVKDHWAANIPVSRGRYNFDEMRFEYYRDPNVALEALKAGKFDIRVENSSRFWATGYTGPAVEKGLLVKEEIPLEGGNGLQGFVYNTRRDKFKDPRVREALGFAFDFEWTNKNLFYDQYARTTSFFSNTELAASGLPGPEELALLEPYRSKLPKAVFEPVKLPPVTDGSGNLRESLRVAVGLLKAAGYEVQQGKLVDLATRQPLTFEILLDQGGLFERIVGPFVKNLERLGVEATIRAVDDAQYEQRIESFDFDMVVSVFGQSLSPGNEQRDYWGSAAAKSPGSRNLIGIEDPAVDALIDKIIQAPTREALIAACRALDRVLLAGHYVIPQWHNRVTRIAAWDKLSRPAKSPRYGIDLDSWWIDPAKETSLQERRRAAGLAGN